MFIGHFAVACAARPRVRGPSLGTWFMAVQWLDLVWPPLVLAGIERVRIDPGNTAVTPLDFVHYPYSHSLLAALLWSLAFAGAYYALRRDGRAALWLGGGVFSHWILDWITHRPDLPLVPGGIKVGLGLWHSLPATIVVEGALFAAGVALYLRATRARDRRGRWACWGLVAFLVLVYLGNLFGPPPPDVRSIGVAGLGLWLMVAWAYWIDRHREPAQ